jgi:hypothetical protein
MASDDTEFKAHTSLPNPTIVYPTILINAAGSDGRRNTGLQFTRGSFEA